MAPIPIPPPFDPEAQALQAEKEVHLCISGGGYRATLFGLGAMWRLNELGALGNTRVISSASGGSILAAHAVLHWPQLNFHTADGHAEKFASVIADPILTLTSETLDRAAVIKSAITWSSAAAYVAADYDRVLFKDKRLRDLPSEQNIPQLSINATRLEDGTLWSFGQGGIRNSEWPGAGKNGSIFDDRSLHIADAVAASSAFPPFLAPLRLDASDLAPDEARLFANSIHMAKGDDPDIAQLVRRRFGETRSVLSTITLVDGGVKNNLATDQCVGEGVNVLIDAAPFTHSDSVWTNWFALMRRVINLMYEEKENRVRSNYVQRDSATSHNVLVDLGDAQYMLSHFEDPRSLFVGPAYSRVQSLVDKNPKRWLLDDDLKFMTQFGTRAALLGSIPTRLKGLDGDTRNHMINLGYILTDIALLGALAHQIAVTPGLSTAPTLLKAVPNLLSAPAHLPFPLHPCFRYVSADLAKCDLKDFAGK